MIVSLDNLYQSELSFLPARSEKGDLEFVDIITSFASLQGMCVYQPSWSYLGCRTMNNVVYLQRNWN